MDSFSERNEHQPKKNFLKFMINFFMQGSAGNHTRAGNYGLITKFYFHDSA